ncbi:perlucin-like [Dreissena polymorpha]|uniref:perlucin-like n=1 Tax=Dreissena polymorpha TaxID=45954 RepID=UPI0022646B5B|nr:perlucin-like [Dreissena polymorpha]
MLTIPLHAYGFDLRTRLVSNDSYLHKAVTLFDQLNLDWSPSVNMGRYCEMVGASLAVIRSQEEEALIDGYICRNIMDEIWYGGTNLLLERTFLDPKTQEVLTYFNWAPGQPDNYGRGEHCLDIFRDDAQMDRSL